MFNLLAIKTSCKTSSITTGGLRRGPPNRIFEDKREYRYEYLVRIRKTSTSPRRNTKCADGSTAYLGRNSEPSHISITLSNFLINPKSSKHCSKQHEFIRAWNRSNGYRYKFQYIGAHPPPKSFIYNSCLRALRRMLEEHNQRQPNSMRRECMSRRKGVPPPSWR
jgi:hypothetical protein